MYYRIAIQTESVPGWKWKSSALESFNLLLQWLQYYRVLPVGRLRIFASPSANALKTQLVPAEDQELWATSVSASQFLHERGLAPSPLGTTVAITRSPEDPSPADGASAPGLPEAVLRRGEAPILEGIYGTMLLRRWDELEGGTGGDHDCPYHFSLPFSMPELHRWVELWKRVQHGDLRREVISP